MPLTDLMDWVQNAAVRHRFGQPLIPRSIDLNRLTPGQVVREPDRILVERLRAEGQWVNTPSVLEARTDLRVRIREGLWEDDGKLDYTALATFVFGCLLYARNLYDNASVERIVLRIGVVNALGRALVDDPTHFSGFHQTYIATTTADLVVSREVAVAAIRAREAREVVAREIVNELGAYFGFRLSEAAWIAHRDWIVENVPQLGA